MEARPRELQWSGGKAFFLQRFLPAVVEDESEQYKVKELREIVLGSVRRPTCVHSRRFTFWVL